MSDAHAGRSVVLTGVAGLWLVAVAAGMDVLIRYSATPGDPGAPPRDWPDDSAVPRPRGRPVLVLMAHPRCPCTRSSIEELSRLMARLRGRLEVRVLFFAPAGETESWWKSDLWTGAAAIPGVQVVADPDAGESRRFHVETSGHALLYDAEGRLLFSGGITEARGHAGDNAGIDAVEALVRGDLSARRATPVFGCALHAAPAGGPAPEGAWRR